MQKFQVDSSPFARRAGVSHQASDFWRRPCCLVVAASGWRGAGEDHVHPRQFLAVYSPRPNPNSNPLHFAISVSTMPLPFLLLPLSTAPLPRARHGGHLEAPRPRGILRVRASGEAAPPPSRTQVSEQPRSDPSTHRGRFSVPGAKRLSYEDFSNLATALREGRRYGLTDVLCRVVVETPIGDSGQECQSRNHISRAELVSRAPDGLQHCLCPSLNVFSLSMFFFLSRTGLILSSAQ